MRDENLLPPKYVIVTWEAFSPGRLRDRTNREFPRSRLLFVDLIQSVFSSLFWAKVAIKPGTANKFASFGELPKEG